MSWFSIGLLTQSLELFREYNTLAEASAKVTEARSAFADSRRAADAFGLSLDPSQLDTAVEWVDESARLLALQRAVALKGAAKDPGLVKLADTLPRLVAAYAATVGKLKRDGIQSDAPSLLERTGGAAAADLDKAYRVLRQRSAELGPQIDQAIVSAIWEACMAVAIALLVGALCSIYVARSISRPLRWITSAMMQLAKGNHEVVIPALERKDEIGDMAAALSVFKANALQIKSLEDERLEQEQESQRSRRVELATLADRFETSVNGLVALVAESSMDLNRSSRSLTSSVAGARLATSMIVEQAREAATKVTMVAHATDELLRTVADVAERSAVCLGMAIEGENQTRETSRTVSDLSGAATRIGKVVSVIRLIAEQTNMLSMNAAIEAATAGEAGRGFAAVADEVKTLAKETSRATTEIEQQITEVQSAAKGAVATMEAISEAIRAFSGSAISISNAGATQRNTIEGVVQAANTVATATDAVSRKIIEVQDSMDANAKAADASRVAAEALRERAQDLSGKAEEFLAFIRAA